MKENIPEKSVERLHLKYDEYKATAEEPIFTFKEFSAREAIRSGNAWV